MRKRTMYIALVGGLALAVPAAVAVAGPWEGARGKAHTRADKDDVAVTVTAGKGRLGVSVIEISPELRAHLGAPASPSETSSPRWTAMRWTAPPTC